MPKPIKPRFFRWNPWFGLAIVVATINGLRQGGIWFVLGLYAVIGLVLVIIYAFWRRSH